MEETVVAKALVSCRQKHVEKLFEAQLSIYVSIKLYYDFLARLLSASFHRIIKHILLQVCGADRLPGTNGLKQTSWVEVRPTRKLLPHQLNLGLTSGNGPEQVDDETHGWSLLV